MGLFSTKKKTVVQTSVSRMIEDSDIKSTQQSAVVEYVLQSTTQVDSDIATMSLPDRLMQAHANSIVAKMDKFYRYAKSGQYYYGLPKASVVLPNANALTSKVKDILDAEYQADVTVEYALIGEPNHLHMAWVELIKQFLYNPETNELERLSALQGTPCYLDDLVVHYSKDTVTRVEDADYFRQYGIAATAGYTPIREANQDAEHSLSVEDAALSSDFARVTYGRMVGGKYTTETLDVDLSDYVVSYDTDNLEGMNETTGLASPLSSEDDYVMGCCTYTQSGKTYRKYFTYIYGSGAYPTLDDLYDTNESTGQYYPRIYARLDNTDLAADTLSDTEAYKSSVKAAKRLDLNWSEWVGQLHDNVEDTGNVQQAFVCLALPAHSKDPLIHEYMYGYFKKLYDSSETMRIDAVSKYETISVEYRENQAKQGASIVIEDEAFKQILNYSAIGSRYIQGKVAEVGEYAYKHGTAVIGTTRLGFISRTNTKTYHAYQYQVSETTYREVRVYGLSFTENVRGGNNTVSTGTSENLLVPIDKVMASEFSLRDRELLYSKGLHIVFNTLQVVKTKWYQSSVFKVVMFIAAVVMSVFTGGQSLTLYAVAMAALNAVVIGLALSALAKLAVKLGVDIKIITVVAVIAMAYAGYLSINNVKGVFDVSAKTLLNASNQALNFTQKIAEVEVANLNKDMSEFESAAKAKEDAMKEVQGMLSSPELIGSDLFMDKQIYTPNPLLNLYQSPNDYYTRTVHTGNPGAACYDLLSGYVDQALVLPKAEVTLANFIQGK